MDLVLNVLCLYISHVGVIYQYIHAYIWWASQRSPLQTQWDAINKNRYWTYTQIALQLNKIMIIPFKSDQSHSESRTMIL